VTPVVLHKQLSRAKDALRRSSNIISEQERLGTIECPAFLQAVGCSLGQLGLPDVGCGKVPWGDIGNQRNFSFSQTCFYGARASAIYNKIKASIA
jgi:hypothetical protein